MSNQPVLTLAPHPLLCCAGFVTRWPAPLGSSVTPPWLSDVLKVDAEVPVTKPPTITTEIRDLLRHGGFKPSGRSKPASEYLIRAATGDGVRSINVAVDACNAVSLHSGFPISLIDLERASPPFSIAIAPRDSEYVFNPAGQQMDLSGLLCLFDEQGACANAVKDSQRTKTHDETRLTLSILWGTVSLADALAEAEAWYRRLVRRLDATDEDVTFTQP